MGNGSSYFDAMSSALSADGLPMVVADQAAAATDLEFVQCQDENCAGAKTVRGFPQEKVGTGGLPVVAVGADGNPIIGFYRDGDRGYGIVHCRDPECQDWRAY